MLRIGLTGGIGSGKSTACRFFEELNVPVIDADQVARDLVEPGSPALDAIGKLFGTSVIRDGQLDRARLRELIFQDPAARSSLEAILHPAIRDEIRSRLAALNSPYSIVAIPLLVEKGWEVEVDRVLLIDATEEHQLARATSRDRMTTAAAKKMLQAQASRKERLAKADDVIENNGDLESLRRQVEMMHGRYVAIAEKH